MTDDLADVVRKLTAPSYEHVFQRRDGEGRTKTVEVPGLLDQMRERVFPSGESNGGGSLKSTRSIGDLDAMYEYAKMAAQIGSWCHMLGVTVTKDATTDLLAWHDKARSILGPAESDWYRRTLNGWLGQIRNHLDPPERFVPPYPCPVCKTTGWGDRINGGDLWPVEVRYRLDEHGNRHDEVARCRAPECGTVWRGFDAVAELGDEMKEHAAISESTVSSTGDES